MEEKVKVLLLEIEKLNGIIVDEGKELEEWKEMAKKFED